MILQSARLTELGLDELAVAAPRRRTATPAQQRAARANGRRSRGPVTFSGKCRSSRNAYRHGLARAVLPPADIRGHDSLYRQIRAELIAEFAPTKFTEYAAVDVMAGEYVELSRVRTMVELLYRPPAPSEQDAGAWCQMTQARSDLTVLDAALANLAAGGVATRDTDKAARLANLIGDYVAQVQGDLADVEVDEAPADGQERAEAEDLRHVAGVLGRAAARFGDRGWVTETIAGRRVLRPADRRRLVFLLTRLATSARDWISAHGEVELRLRRQQEEAMAVIARDPGQLLVLRRYQSRIEHAIGKKLRDLRPK